MASNSGWDKTIPSGSSKVSGGDDDIRSFKSFMEAWWEDEHFALESLSTNAGKHRPGSAKIFKGPLSQLSNADRAENDGKLFHATDTDALYIAHFSTSSWSIVADNIKTSSVNTWTALQNFSSDISASDLNVGGSITGILSGSTFTFATSISNGGSYRFGITITGARPGDWCIPSCTSHKAAAGDLPVFISACTVNDEVEFRIENNVGSTWSLVSDETFSVLVIGNPDRS